MQCLPQYNAENSVTNQLVKQLKKANFQYLPDQCSSAISNSSSSAFPTALGAENLHAAMTFATQTSVDRIHEGYRKIIRRDRCRSLLILKMSIRDAVPALHTTKMMIFHFHEKSFASYNEFVDSKRFSRLLRTDLPLETCLYTTLLIRDIAVQSFRTVTRLYDLLTTTRDEWWTMCLRGTRIYSVWVEDIGEYCDILMYVN